MEELKKDDLTISPMQDQNKSSDQHAAIPDKPLALIAEITDTAGLDITYQYDDLVFISNVIIYRFTEIGSQVDLFFNKDCETEAEQQLSEKLISAAEDKGITLSKRGHYKLSEADGENISIEFFEYT